MIYYKNRYILLFILLTLTCIFLIVLSNPSYCADPKIVTKLNSALGKVRDWMIKLSTPAAAIAVGTGVFITKFSFGDDDKIIKGKRLIRTSLYSYGFIISVELILKAMDSLIG